VFGTKTGTAETPSLFDSHGTAAVSGESQQDRAASPDKQPIGAPQAEVAEPVDESDPEVETARRDCPDCKKTARVVASQFRPLILNGHERLPELLTIRTTPPGIILRFCHCSWHDPTDAALRGPLGRSLATRAERGGLHRFAASFCGKTTRSGDLSRWPTVRHWSGS